MNKSYKVPVFMDLTFLVAGDQQSLEVITVRKKDTQVKKERVVVRVYSFGYSGLEASDVDLREGS